MISKESIVSIAIRILASTWRITVQGEFPQHHGVVAFWHGVMLPVWKIFSSNNVVGLTSKSKDGNFLTTLLHDWHYTVVRGSSSQGSKEALSELVDLAANSIVLLTPDGPRGPNREMKPGAVVCAFRAQVPIYCLTVQVQSSITLKKSWDNFCIPLPFSKITITIHPPITIASTSTREEISAIIAQCSTILRSE